MAAPDGTTVRRGAHVAAVCLMVAALVALIAGGSPRDWFVDDTKFAREIEAAAHRNQVDPQLVRALVFRESRFDPFTRGSKGEVGLMQLLPAGSVADYARLHKMEKISVAQLCRPEVNLEIGCWYLKGLLRKYQSFRHGTELALAAYNAGVRRADRWKPEDPEAEVVARITIRSTREYVKWIVNRYNGYLK